VLVSTRLINDAAVVVGQLSGQDRRQAGGHATIRRITV